MLLLQVLPLLGAAVVFAFKERSTAVVAGKLFALAELLLCIVVASRIKPTVAVLQLAERFAPLGYHVAVDGVSIVFLLVAALLTFLMTLYGMSRGMISPGRLFAVLLLAEAGLKLPGWANVLLPRATNLGCYIAVLVMSGYPAAVVALGSAVAAFAPGAVYDALKAARAVGGGGGESR